MLAKDLISLILEMYPDFKGSKIDIKTPSPNGIPIFIQKDGKNYWLKLLVSPQMEGNLRDIEQQALKGLDSPHVVKLLAIQTKFINAERYDALLFDYIEGKDLEDILKDLRKSGKKWNENEATKLLKEVVIGINAIWENGWVHQDIKPKNIRLDVKNNKYLLLDLGIAHYFKDFSFSDGKHPKDHASPEQIRASIGQKVAVTFNSDLFQLGTIIYELLTLKHPFKESSKHKIDFKKVVAGEYSPIKSLIPEMSAKLASVIGRMLNPHAGYRFRSPQELLHELDDKKYAVESRFVGGVYFQPWPGPQGYKNILNYSVSSKIEGVLISASHIPSEAYLRDVKEQGYKIILDPETFLLCDTIQVSWHGDLPKHKWYQYPLNHSFFKDLSRVRVFVADVIQTQLQLGASYIVPPYFNIDNLVRWTPLSIQ
ncbi:MAG: receptor protein-tyrosine kinase [Microgenomates group bacterium Gr01-1014_7]|nr:MAG: receptor protein-tyrosine kinase [Microgenomates group bacterium Gr01-1014_7]